MKLSKGRIFIILAALIVLLFPPTIVASGWTTHTRFTWLFSDSSVPTLNGTVNVAILSWMGFILGLLWLSTGGVDKEKK